MSLFRRDRFDAQLLATLRTGLAESAAWCEADLRDVSHVRAAALLPPLTDGRTGETPCFRLLGDAESLMTSIALARRADLAARGARVPRIAELTVSRGRVLLCEYISSLFDRSCHEESRGFLDDDEIPPCGTWCGLVPAELVRIPSPDRRPALVAWVPERFVPYVGRAIECCPTETNRWLADVNEALEREVLRGG